MPHVQQRFGVGRTNLILGYIYIALRQKKRIIWRGSKSNVTTLLTQPKEHARLGVARVRYVPVRVSITLPSRETACPSTVPSSLRQSHPGLISGSSGLPIVAC